MKLNLEQRQRAQEIVEKMAEEANFDQVAEELIGFHDKLKKLVEAAKVFDRKPPTSGDDPDELHVGTFRGAIIHLGELRRLHEALIEAEDSLEE